MKKILIVDDKRMNRNVLRRSFIFFREKEDFDIKEASSAKEAVVLAIEFKPDLILMDIEMETDYAGLEATKEIRKKLKNPSLQIWAITSHALFQNGINTDANKCLNAGCNKYFAKPYEQKEIILAISETLNLNLPDDILKKIKST